MTASVRKAQLALIDKFMKALPRLIAFPPSKHLGTIRLYRAIADIIEYGSTASWQPDLMVVRIVIATGWYLTDYPDYE